MEQIANVQSSSFAVLLSLLLPGIGQFYNGKIGKGITFLILSIIGWFIIVFGTFFSIVAAVDVHRDAKDSNYIIEVQNRNRNYFQNQKEK